ncbi:hypothetical protein GCM10018954_054280 [Kutzneria kofuensis]
MLLAGDAAHVHPPFGGQGMNLGIGDAVNLGWKLAATIRGTAAEGLLDTYQRERHPVGKWVQDWAMAQVALLRPDPRSRALREVMRDLLDTADGATYVVKNISGVARTQAPAVVFEDGSRLADHCHDGRPVLVGDAELLGIATKYGIAFVEGPEPLLVRPDGVVAWSGEGDPESVLRQWFCHSFDEDPYCTHDTRSPPAMLGSGAGIACVSRVAREGAYGGEAPPGSTTDSGSVSSWGCRAAGPSAGAAEVVGAAAARLRPGRPLFVAGDRQAQVRGQVGAARRGKPTAEAAGAAGGAAAVLVGLVLVEQRLERGHHAG